MTKNGFSLPTKQLPPSDDCLEPDPQATWRTAYQMRRAVILAAYNDLKWFGEIEATDAPALAEQIRRRKRRAG